MGKRSVVLSVYTWITLFCFLVSCSEYAKCVCLRLRLPDRAQIKFAIVVVGVGCPDVVLNSLWHARFLCPSSVTAACSSLSPY